MALSQYWIDSGISFMIPYAIILGRDEKPLLVRFCHGELISDKKWSGARISHTDYGLTSYHIGVYLPDGVFNLHLPILTWDNKVVSKGNTVLFRDNTRALVINEEGIIFECDNVAGEFLYNKKKLAVDNAGMPTVQEGSNDFSSCLTEFSAYDFMNLNKDVLDTLECDLNAREVILPEEMYSAHAILGASVEKLIMPKEMSYCRISADYAALKELLLPEINYGTTFIGLTNVSLKRLEFNSNSQYHTFLWVRRASLIEEIKVGTLDIGRPITQFETIFSFSDCPKLRRVEIPVNADGYNYVYVTNCPNLKRVILKTRGKLPDNNSLITIVEGSSCEFILTP